jgi:hypothetical protein
MTRTHRVFTTGALILCFIGTQFSSPIFASGEVPSSNAAAPAEQPSSPRLYISPDLFNTAPAITAAESQGFAQRYPRYRGGGRNRVQHQEIILGALASIAGGALLVYANRPECSATNHMASGCQYGTKVIGGSVLTAGLFGVALGAVTWR